MKTKRWLAWNETKTLDEWLMDTRSRVGTKAAFYGRIHQGFCVEEALSKPHRGLPNEVRIEGEVAYLILTQGQETCIDLIDVPLIIMYKWYANRHKHTYYAETNVLVNGKRTILRLHSLLCAGQLVDHIDGNGLNNKRINLRTASHQENLYNTKARAGTSRFKGVSWCKRRGRWRVTIQGKHIGYYDNEELAAYAYNQEATKLFGLFAKLNN